MSKLRNTIMLLLILAAFYFFYVEMMPVKITAAELAKIYLNDPNKADRDFLNKRLEISGNIKAIRQLHDKGNIIELETNEDAIKLYCFIRGNNNKIKLDSLNFGEQAKITGMCEGLDQVNSVPAVNITVEQIKF